VPVVRIKHVNAHLKMTQRVIEIEGRRYVEVFSTMVPEELTREYMDRTNPNRDAEIEAERAAHRATIPKSDIDLSYQNWHPMRAIEKLK
jgi:hypothetical protein